MASGVEARFEAYCDRMIKALGHADRATPARWYLRGLMLPGERKSMSPWLHAFMQRTCARRINRCITWWRTLSGAIGRCCGRLRLKCCRCSARSREAPAIGLSTTPRSANTGSTRWVWRVRYCGHLGKTENCQVAVSLSFATAEGSLPLAYRLYLPAEWADDEARRKRAGVPESVAFATKHEIAWTQIEAALAAGIARGTVLMDAGYENAILRDRLTEHQLRTLPASTLRRCCGGVSISPGRCRQSLNAAPSVNARCAMRRISRSAHCTSHEHCPLRPIAP